MMTFKNGGFSGFDRMTLRRQISLIDPAVKLKSSAFSPNFVTFPTRSKMASLIRQLRPAVRFLTKVKSTPCTRNYAEAAPAGAVKDMPLTFASANQVFYDDEDVKQVDVPTFTGMFGILPKHVPILGVLSPGVVTVFQKDGNNKKIFVSSGTLCVNADSSVQILAEEAHFLEDLDQNAARSALEQAQKDLSSAPAEKKEEYAIAVEVADAIVKAL